MASSPTLPLSASSPPAIPSSNPLPLSAAQEAQVRDIYYKRVRTKCADEIKVFAECAMGRTFTATWKCRNQRHAMNSCMIGYATLKEQDAAREEWFAGRDDRLRERELKQKEQEEKKQKHHEWWGLDEQGRRVKHEQFPAASNVSPETNKVINR